MYVYDNVAELHIEAPEITVQSGLVSGRQSAACSWVSGRQSADSANYHCGLKSRHGAVARLEEKEMEEDKTLQLT